MMPSWNRRCAAPIVRSADHESFRLASCCSVDVVNGAYGRCVAGRSSTEVTDQGRRSTSSSLRRRADASSSSRALVSLSLPDAGSKSLPVASRLSPIRCSLAVNEEPDAVRRASRSQYALFRNAPRSSSRSTMRRTATL